MRNRPATPEVVTTVSQNGQPVHAGPPPMAGGSSGVPAAQTPAQMMAAPPRVGSFAARGKGPKPKRYRVLNGGMIVQHGCRSRLLAGKEIDSTQYNLAFLKRQGIKLEEIVDETEPSDEGGESPGTPGTA